MMDFGLIGAKELARLGIVTSEAIVSATVRDAETLRRRYAQDPTQQALVDRMYGEVDICSNMIARACSMQPIKLYRIGGGRGTKAISRTRARKMAAGLMGHKAQSLVESSDNVVEVEAHPILDFIRRPNPYYPGSAMDFMKFKFGCVNGEFYTFITDDGRGGKLGWPGYPQYTMPVFDDQKLISHYLFGRDSTDMVEIPPDQVIPWKNYIRSRSNPNRGEGEVVGVLVEADLIQATNLHDLAFTRNGCRPDALVSVTAPEPVNGDQLDALYDKMEEWRQGGRREGMPFVGQYIDWKPLTWAPKDMLTTEKVENARKMIRRALGIPESMADSNASTYASAMVADAQMGRVVWAKLIHDAAEKTEWMLPEFGLDPTRYAFGYDNPVPGDEQAEVTRLNTVVRVGGMSINELRAEIGLDPSPDPSAEKLLFEGRPLGESAQPPMGSNPFAGLFAPRREEGDRQQAELVGQPPESTTTTETNPDSAQKPENQATEAQKTVSTSPPVDLAKAAMAFEHPRWVPPHGDCCKMIANASDAAYDRFGADLRASIEDIIADAQDEATRAFADRREPDLTQFREQAESILRDQVQAIAEDALKTEVERLGMGEDFFRLIPERAVEFARTYTIQLAGDIMNTTAEISRQAVTAGLEQGWSIAKIQAEIEGVPAHRAEVIARTETARASGGARYSMYSELGATHSEWVLGPGACPLCEGIAAKGPVPLGQPFAGAGEVINGVTASQAVFFNPAHPNCRCSVEPLFPEDVEAEFPELTEGAE